MLDLAARVALRGAGRVEPNPMVGAVVVRDGRVIGLGHHRVYGALHAEREAIASCLAQGNDPRGATVYCTLEPCCHTGKQPPCTEALIERGIARVVYARPDPHEVSGGGRAVLRAAGIEAELSGASESAARLSDPFVMRVQRGRPWIIVKWAQTIDGRIATRTGESQWISSARSRARVHRLRGRVDAVLTGSGTVLADDPMLTARGVRVRRIAKRVVVDSSLKTPLDSKLVRTAREFPTLIVCAADLAAPSGENERRAALEGAGVEILGAPAEGGRLRLLPVFEALAQRHDVTNVLVEAGPALIGSLFEDDLVDEAVVYVAPMVLGDDEALASVRGRSAPTLSMGKRMGLWRVKPIGDDVELTYRRSADPSCSARGQNVSEG